MSAMRTVDNTVQAAAGQSAVPATARILIADDSRLQRLMLEKMLNDANYQVISACDGAEALELYSREQPDLVVLDITMPLLNGIEVAHKIRCSEGDGGVVPIIFITGIDDGAYLQRCVDVGGDDFLGKPFNPVLLQAKVDSLLRFKRLYQEQLEQKRSLQKYQQAAAQEQEVAAALYNNILQADFLEAPNLRYSLSPMALFNGDVLLSAKSPGNQLYCLLGDFTGHGISASVGAGPAAEIFYGMVQKGFGAEEILTEINRKMHKLLPVNMFLAATLVTLNPESCTLTVITCGLPDHYLVNLRSGAIMTIASRNLPLGITAAFALQEQHFEVTQDDFLYMFTDGVIEAENLQGEQFGDQRLAACLARDAAGGFDLIKKELQRHCRDLQQQDDITLVALQCAVEDAPWIAAMQQEKHAQIMPLTWKSAMELHVTTLRHLNPVPVMVNSLMEVQGLHSQRESIFVIVSELFTNALDHGLLQLDSELKATSEGFIQYFQIREERLEEAIDGRIKVSFDHQPIDNGGRLVIRVQDSGQGFDSSQVYSRIDDNVGYFGRGIQLVKKLCREVEYSDAGNRVKAVFEWHI